MLLSPICLKNLTINNRIVMPPMCNFKAGRDGLVTDWHLIHYASRAVGGAGMIIVEATGIEDRGRISSRCLGIWQDGQIAGLKKIVDLVHGQGAKIAIQLNHAGRKSEVEYLEPVGPSALAFNRDCRPPKELTVLEIKEVVSLFAAAAERAVVAGFDAIEIHGAHGYLINQFLSPLSNKRSDDYGGVPENRVRLLDEVVRAIRCAIPAEMPLIVRVSASDYNAAGNTPEVIAAMLNLVKAQGLDLVNVSSGGVIPMTPRVFPGYQIPFALAIKEKTGLPVIGGGLIAEPAQAQQVVMAGVDMVFIGRALLRDPYWPLRAAFVLGQEISWPEPYVRAKF
ncbi:MAG: NADH:flavin oxidoreductase/NADH oxidase [Negativicutes bacterium]